MKLKSSLKGKMLSAIVFPILIMTIIVTVVGVSSVSRALIAQSRDSMSQIANAVLSGYDDTYPGDFDIQIDTDKGTYRVLKGEADITSEHQIVDGMSKSMDVQISIFCQSIRVETSLADINGDRYITTKANPMVVSQVLEKGEAHFYEDVDLWGERCYVYYAPITMSDGRIYGMVGVAKSKASLNAIIKAQTWKVPLATILSAIVFAIVAINVINTITKRISELEKYTKAVATGNFKADIPARFSKGDDEVSSLIKNTKDMTGAIRQLVDFDALTQLYNRRCGDKRYVESVERCVGSKQPYCIAIGDIDFFKKVNDTYGHEAGDEILKNVAGTLKLGMPAGAFVARWGGEEFFMVFERHTLEEAEAALNAVLDKIRAMTTVFDGQTIKVTMSFGVTAGIPGESKDAGLKRADENLYFAKENGRNQVRAV